MSWILFMCLWLQAGTTQQLPADDEPLFEDELEVDVQASLTLVNLSLRVSREDQLYRDLSAEELLITEDGKSVPVFDISEVKTPLTLHFLFDLSTSHSNVLIDLKRDVTRVISDLDDEDASKVGFFSGYYQSLTDYTRDRKKLRKALRRLTPIGSTALYDGMAESLNELKDRQGTRLLIVYSDGHDLLSATTEQELYTLVANYQIPIVFVAYRGLERQGELLQGQIDFLVGLAERSGGRVFRGDLKYLRELRRYVRRMRHRYRVSFEPHGAADKKRWRALDIQIRNCDDCDLEYKRAYQIQP
jgi:VWFA-related protein